MFAALVLAGALSSAPQAQPLDVDTAINCAGLYMALSTDEQQTEQERRDTESLVPVLFTLLRQLAQRQGTTFEALQPRLYAAADKYKDQLDAAAQPAARGQLKTQWRPTQLVCMSRAAAS